jgi:RimJ/RimL family protein N-acetyltransferase
MIGFWVRTSETGKGYATEAAKALLNYELNDLGLRVYSMHAAENQNSQAVLLRLGFQPTHTEKACQQLLNAYVVDKIYYELKS